MSALSRRQFALMAGAGLAASAMAQAQKGKLAAGEVVGRIQKNLGIPWNGSGFRDTFKMGGPDMEVAGIAVTFMSTWALLQKAQKAGLNMIITHEPTFWSDADLIEPIKNDPLYHQKLDWSNRNKLVVWRIHDNWHAHKPDGIRMGWNEGLDWVRYQATGVDNRWNIPPTTLGELAKSLAKALESRSIRVVGDPNLPVAKITYGSHSLDANMSAMQEGDCVIISEAREYDSHEYCRDTVLTGAKKGAIVISHESGEEMGMDKFAKFLKPLVTEVPVQFISTTDIFWTV